MNSQTPRFAMLSSPSKLKRVGLSRSRTARFAVVDVAGEFCGVLVFSSLGWKVPIPTRSFSLRTILRTRTGP